jgi:hypothetical protein
MAIRIFSFGGGVQSTAALVLAAQGVIDFPTFVFANVGEDSENPETLAYVEAHAKPFAAASGIELVEIRKEWRDGRDVTLLQSIHAGERSLSIPVRMSGSGAPGNRGCTGDFKIKPLAKFAKERGATGIDPAILGLGISLDEFQRMRNDSGFSWVQHEYPLIQLRLDRAACMALIERAGLPLPPKSSCWFCPMHNTAQWAEMRRRRPELFEQAAALEDTLNARRLMLGKDPVWMHFEDSCESGYCMV